ncbi:hypothetical protein Gilli_1769 [Gillisia limnaea DSM 15749]|uniref:Uncharacterized protein n=1 Tax=Gillisia limnaea (strain DSM 15749 / LMG 21470 / R-8282) TaxID=865937 RepID=H2C045_GILLR|nr:hypothetical protein Gilli_1769 [Gillisia limnaea DSM 15749]
MTKTPRNVILNAVKNPAYSLGESCLKGHKSFTTRTIAQAVGILPRPKARSEWTIKKTQNYHRKFFVSSC